MPQADLHYSADLSLDTLAMLGTLEKVIAAHDASAGDCKGRALPVRDTHHTHVMVRLRMLEKSHRDDAFMQALLEKLRTALSPMVPADCVLSIEIGFLGRHYSSGLSG